MRRSLRRTLFDAWRALRTLTTALCLAAAGWIQAAPALPDLDAVVSYETRQITAAGVLRTEVWKERLVRRGDVVWTERVLPAETHAAHAHESSTEHAGHKHFDFESAARLLRLDAKGQLQLQYVDREHRVVVSVPKAEYGVVGFDGRWDAAAHVVPPSVVARMPVTMNSGAAVWHEEKAPGWSHRVLWSEARQVALRVESQRSDGSFRRVVSVEPVAPTGGLPWKDLATFTQKEYDDFMD
ncbi:hypothetical protein [Piscinibacter sp.]|uniref:hypothetical protein n=1 Tax=Piscinibacter sp. TaxID=1903157 RepID=UPI002F415431